MTSPRLCAAIDAHTIGRQATGNETYVEGLLSALVDDPDIEPVALMDAATHPPPWLQGVATGAVHRNPIIRLARDLRRSGERWGADVLHVQYVRPPRSDIPVVTAIHDISFEHFPELFTKRTRARMRLTIPWSARRSARVLTGSHHARADIIERYELAPDAVAVTPYAARDEFRRLDAESVDACLASVGIERGYLLCVGNLQPRKNLRRLLEAYAGLAADRRPRLVIVGQAAWLYQDVYAAVRTHGLADAVHFTGFVSTDMLVALYNGARVFAYPSLYEGFGLPVLEALACGVPTLTSNTSSLPEVGGDAALLVDPLSTEALREGLDRLLTDTELRSRLILAGPRQAARFTWRRCATLTADAYRLATA